MQTIKTAALDGTYGVQVKNLLTRVQANITKSRIVRLVGAVLAEQTDEWAEGRRYLGLEVLARCRLTAVPDTGRADHELPELEPAA